MKKSDKKINIIVLFISVFLIFDFCFGLFLEDGLNKYYGIGSNSEIALVGHSHLMLGVDKVKLEKALNLDVSKYTSEGVNILNRKLMIEQLLEKNNNIKTIIYGVDAWSFTGEGLSKNSHVLFYPFLDDMKINNYVRSKAPFSDYWVKKLIKSTRYNEGLIAGSFRGHLGKWDNLKSGSVNIERLNENILQGNFRLIKNNPQNIKILTETIEILKKNNIKVILLYVPTIDIVNQFEKYKFQETLEIFINFTKKYDNVDFVNFLEPFSHQHELFFDPIHLNPKGQSVITDTLIKVLNNY